jgi:SAM-dependent methyltransferase
MNTETRIREYWEDKAEEFRSKHSSVSMTGNTLNDDNLRSLEIAALMKYVQPGTRILDVGCGNGYTACQLATAVDLTIDGIDFSPGMVRNARQLLLDHFPQLRERVRFDENDVLDETALAANGMYDSIISERCLINLPSWEDQMKAIGHIAACLRRNGLFLALEGFIDNLTRINSIRALMGLNPIDVVWHNLFFEKARFEQYVSSQFHIDHIDGFGSTYMLLTRTLIHKLQDIGHQKFDAEIDRLATLLPNEGNYNYQQLYVLRKK